LSRDEVQALLRMRIVLCFLGKPEASWVIETGVAILSTLDAG
jgi:hypothetical protein